MMGRLNIFLLTALIACALSVVHTSYRQRRLFIALERARVQQQQLQQEGAQLYYQQRALSKTARIERLAAHQLKMVPAANVVTQYLVVPETESVARGDAQ